MGGGGVAQDHKGLHTRWAVRGWRVNISEDARHWIGLLQYNPSTRKTQYLPQRIHPVLHKGKNPPRYSLVKAIKKQLHLFIK